MIMNLKPKIIKTIIKSVNIIKVLNLSQECSVVLVRGKKG